MARDFRTRQIRTSIVIGSGSAESSKPHLGLVFYSASKASDFEGTRRTGGGGPISNEHKTDSASSYLNLTHAKIGDDVWCLFDGHPASQGTERGLDATQPAGGNPSAAGNVALAGNSYGSTVLFLGNVTVSGSLYAERQVIEVDNTVPGNFVTPSASRAYFAGGFHGNGTYNPSSQTGGVTIENTGDIRVDGFVQTNIIKNHNSSNLTIDTVTNGDIIMTAAGGNITMRDDDQAHDIFDFNVASPSLTIYDDADVDGDRDYFKISVDLNGVTQLSTHADDDSVAAHITLLSDGDINLDTTSGYIGFRHGSTDTSDAADEFGFVKLEDGSSLNDFQWYGYGNGSNANTQQLLFSFVGSKKGATTAKPTFRFNEDIKLEFRDANVYIHSHEADGVKMEATGNMLIGSTLANEKTLTLGNTASTHMLLSPHGTAGSEKILIKNAAGDTEAAAADAAIKIEAAAGGVTIAAEKKIVLEADGGVTDITDNGGVRFRFDSPNDRFSIFNKDGAQDYFTITCGTDGETTLASNHHEGSGAHIGANIKIDADGDIYLDPHGGDIAIQHAGTLQGYWGLNQVTADVAWYDGDAQRLFSMANTTAGGTASSLRMSTSKKLEFHDDSQFIHAPSDNNLIIKAPSALTLETDQYGAICTRPEGIHLGNAARNGVASVNGENSEYRIFVATGSMGRASAQAAADPFDQLGGNGTDGSKFHPLIAAGSLVISNRSALTPDRDGAGAIVFDGSATFTAAIFQDIMVRGNLTVQGGTTTLNTETITSVDPVIDIGGVINDAGDGSAGGNADNDTYNSTVTSAEANKDRGLVMRYWNGSASATAFMGIDPGAGFKFFSAASESSGAYSGTYGALYFNLLRFQDSTGTERGWMYAAPGGSTHAGNFISLIEQGGVVHQRKKSGDGGPADNTAAGPFYQLTRLQNSAELTSGQNLGEIRFAEGEDANLNISAQINATATDTWSGNGTCPAEIGFLTRSTDAASLTKKMVVRPDGKVGIGAAVPGAQLEVLAGSGAQLKLSYDGSNASTFTVASDGDTTWTATDAIIDAAGDIILDADGDQVSIKFGDATGQIDFTQANSGDGIIQQKVDAKDLIFQQFDGNEVIRVGDDRKLYFFDKGGEYISGNGTDLTIDAGGDITIGTATTKIEWGSDSGEHIVGDGSDGLTMASGAAINLTAATDVNLPAQVGLTFGAATEKIEADSSNNLSIIAAGDIELNAAGGDITLKNGSNTAFSINTTTANTGIINDQAGSEVFRITNNLVRMANGKKIEFGDAGESIHGDTNDLILTSGRHVNLAGSSAQLNFGSSDHRIYLDSNVLKFRDSEVTTPVTLERLVDVSPANGTLFSIGDSGEKRAKSTGGMVISSRDKYMTQAAIYADGTPIPTDLFFYVGDDAGSRTNSAFKNNVVISGSLHMADNTLATGNNPLTTGRVFQNAGQTIFTTTINNGSGGMSAEEHFWLKPGSAGTGGLFLHSNRMLAFSDNVASGDVALAIQRVLHTVEGNASQKCMQHKGHIIPQADNTFNLGTADRRFANLYTGDLHLNNMGSSNDVDGTSGNWTIQEGEDSLYVINNLTGKRFKMMLQPVEDGE